MTDEHHFDSLKNPFMFACMAVIGCSVGHTLMAPLGLFDLTGQAGSFLTELFHGVSSEIISPAAEALAEAGGECHLHGSEMVCH